MIDIAKIADLATTLPVDEGIDEDGLTGYGVWKIAKDVFESLGMEFTITSQRVYNDLRAGRVDGTKGTHRVVAEESVEMYIAKMVRKAQ